MTKLKIIEQAGKLLAMRKGGYKTDKDWKESYWITKVGWSMRIQEVIQVFNDLGYKVILRKKKK